jgi:hypothetical protein
MKKNKKKIMTELQVLNYEPNKRDTPRLANVGSAWGNIPTILKDIIERFDIKTESAIEFGVEYGYSTSALSNYFENVTGVDIFTGDQHAGYKGDIYDITKSNLDSFDGIELIKKSYQEFINENNNHYNLAHVDIIHTYEDTYACGEWCINHSDIVIFHDTLSFRDVFRACYDLANKYNLDFHNYQESHGLGILVKS